MNIKTPEDEEFERIERESGWRKQQISQQVSLQDRYDEAIYLLREAVAAFTTCVILENDETGKEWYYFNESRVIEAQKIINDYLEQNG